MIHMQMVGYKLLNELSELIDAPIMICDQNGVVVAATYKNRINSFHEGVLTVIRDRMPLYISKHRAQAIQGAREETLIPLFVNDIVFGVLLIEGSILQTEPYIKMTMRMAEMLIEQIVTADNYNPEMQLLELFLAQLFAGRLTQKEIDVEFEKLGLEPIYERVAIIQLEIGVEMTVMRHLIHIQTIHPKALIARYYDNRLVILVPKVARCVLQEALQLSAQKLEKLTESQVYIGVGNCQSLHALAQSYSEAEKALAMCTTVQPLIFEEDLQLELLLIESTHKSQEQYVQRMLGPIMNEPELMLNLDIWMNNSQSLKAVAEQLHIHKNTLKYRMKKIEQLLQVDLHSVKDQSALYVALFLYKRHSIAK